MSIHGREPERAAVARLLERVREGRGEALVVRGGPGLGKSALLGDAATGATGMRVLRTQGIESEMPLAFAALQRLLRPVMRYAERIPDAQAEALRVALGEASGEHVDRFLVFLGALGLLAEAAEERPVLAVVDDAHWLDDASAAALLFVARRLEIERVALLFGAREDGAHRFESGDLPELVLRGLDPAAAAEVLSDHTGLTVPTEVAAQLAAGTAGNPLALVELASALDQEQLEGRAPLPRRLPVTDGVERVFAARADRLGPDAQTLLLVAAAADDDAPLATVLRAGQLLEVDPDSLAEVERSGLLDVVAGRIRMRHPLVRAALYERATSVERRRAHRALADAMATAVTGEDADRRVWHLAAATDLPDESVVAELDEVADRAHVRGGHEAAAAAYERAAELTVDPAGRDRRQFLAARCAWLTGQPGRARILSDAVRQATADPVLRADAARLSARVEWNTGSAQRGHQMVLQAAREVADTDPVRAQELAMFGAALATVVTDPVAGVEPRSFVLDPERTSSLEERTCAELIVGLDHLVHQRWGEASTTLRPLFELGPQLAGSEQDLLPNLGVAATNLGDDEASYALHEQILGTARESGAMVMALYALTRLAALDVATGQWGSAEARASEAVRLGEGTGQLALAALPQAMLLLLASLRGEPEDRALAEAVERALAAPPVGTLDVWLRDLSRWRRGLQSTERPAAAFHHFAQISNPVTRRAALLDRVDSALRAEQVETARLWADEMSEFAEATGHEWALANAALVRAQVAGPDGEEQFELALAHHARAAEAAERSGAPGTRRRFDRARTELAYGEFLRRARRRVDAREHLRAAMAVFEDLEARPFVERAAQELRASGETARKREPGTAVRLTPQEVQVATLVAQGLSNREVAAQLFLSPRTIDFHLRNVFAKTGVSSRVELATLPLG